MCAMHAAVGTIINSELSLAKDACIRVFINYSAPDSCSKRNLNCGSACSGIRYVVAMYVWLLVMSRGRCELMHLFSIAHSYTGDLKKLAQYNGHVFIPVVILNIL